MKKNIGNFDKALRLLIIIAFIALFYFGIVSGIIATIGFIIIGQIAITGLIGFCPIYSFFRINTCKRRDTNRAFSSWD